MHLTLFKKKKPDKIEIVRNKTLKRVQAFRKHFLRKSIEDNSIQLFHIMRMFFSEKFKIRYEFTFDELTKELGRKRIDKNLEENILIFLKKLSVVEYSDQKLSESELKKLLKEFLKFFNKLTFNEQKIKETKITSILRFFRIKRTKTLKKEDEKKQPASNKKQKKTTNTNIKPQIRRKKLFLLPNITPIKFGVSLKRRRLKNIHDMLIKAFDMLNNNEFQGTKRLYIKIKKKYNKLTVDEKKEVYDDILILYKEIISSTKT